MLRRVRNCRFIIIIIIIISSFITNETNPWNIAYPINNNINNNNNNNNNIPA